MLLSVWQLAQKNWGSDVDVFKSVHVENFVKRILRENFVGKVLLMRQNLCYDDNKTPAVAGMADLTAS